MPFHIEILYDELHYLYELNLSKEYVEKVADDYINNRNFFFYGRTIFPRRISRFLVFRGNYNINSRSAIRLFTDEVSRDFIKTPPVFHLSHDSGDIEITREGVFIKGQSYDALKLVNEIILEAEESIILIDGFIDTDTLDLLSEKKEVVNVKILTYEVGGSLVPLAQAWNRQYKNLEIHTSRDMHDRFIIIDEKDFYHFGYSFKDLGRKGFMFSKIEENVMKKTLLDEFNRIWDHNSEKI